MYEETSRLGDIYRWLITSVGTMTTYLWGGWDSVMTALVVLVCIDYVTGVVAAAVCGRLDSRIGARGIARKVGIFIVVAAANVLDNTGGLGEPVLRTIACWWYCANEGLSILENAGEMGVPVPANLRIAVARLRDGGDDEHESVH